MTLLWSYDGKPDVDVEKEDDGTAVIAELVASDADRMYVRVHSYDHTRQHEKMSEFLLADQVRVTIETRDIDEHLAFMEKQSAEHAAWIMVTQELRRAGVGDINAGGAHERLHDHIVLWAEELAQLRLADPNPEHAANALEQRREKWARDWEDK